MRWSEKLQALKVLKQATQFLGSHVARDSWVSVMYPEGLNSAKSSGTLQRTDRHGILDQKRSDFQESV
jgi:hypothetical protein